MGHSPVLAQAGSRSEIRRIPNNLVPGEDGSQIKSFRGAWDEATEKAGYPDKLLHDFRRTAVRNLERAGVARSSAMKMVGHATEAIYRRYAIQDEAMLRAASAKLEAWTEEQKTKPGRGQVKQFRRRTSARASS